MPTRKRLRIEIYVDVLQAICSGSGNGHAVNYYRIEREAALTHTRARRVVSELMEHGLVEEPLQVSQKGFAFLRDISSKVFPVLESYGLRTPR